MPFYRGVNTAYVSASLQQAEKFLRRLDLGPATTAHLDQWQKSGMPQRLFRTSDEGICGLMNNTGGRCLLHSYHNLFALHAVMEFAGGAQTGALRLYSSLMAWSAFHDKPRKEDPAIAQEATASQVLLLLEVLKGLGDSGDVKLAAELESLQAKNPRLALDMKQLMPMYLFVYNCGYPDTVKDLLAEQPVIDNGLVIEYFKNAIGLRQACDAMDVPQAFQSYMIKLNSAASTDRRTFMEVIDFYNELSEIGSLNGLRQKDVTTYRFCSTRRVAEMLAYQLPDKNILDKDGKRVMPASPRGGHLTPPGPF